MFEFALQLPFFVATAALVALNLSPTLRDRYLEASIGPLMGVFGYLLGLVVAYNDAVWPAPVVLSAMAASAALAIGPAYFMGRFLAYDLVDAMEAGRQPGATPAEDLVAQKAIAYVVSEHRGSVLLAGGAALGAAAATVGALPAWTQLLWGTGLGFGTYSLVLASRVRQVARRHDAALDMLLGGDGAAARDSGDDNW